MNTIKQAIQSYLSDKNYQRIALKAMLFDMDGVLYDSMPSHAKAWNSTMKAHGINLSFEDAYLHEGRTGADTIHIICRREGIELPEEKVAAIYQEKVKVFENMPTPEPMKGSYELLQKVVRDGLSPMVVTGSGQPSLIDKLNVHFPHIFQREQMVTAFDVKRGKPNPEPYLMGLSKGNLQPWEAFVVENAPLGVEAGRAAGLFVIAVNTGPLPDKYLSDAGANLLFPSMTALGEAWEDIKAAADTGTI